MTFKNIELLKAEHAKIKSDVIILYKKMNKLDHNSRNNNIVIHDVLELKNQNIVVLENICAHVNFNINVDKAFRQVTLNI